MVYNWLRNVLCAMDPAHCPLCATRTRNGFCEGCRADLPWLGHACRTCGIPLPESAGAVCGSCTLRPPPLDRVRAPLAWRPPVDRLVHALKFRERLDLARPLASLWTPDTRPEALVPVPLHPDRLRERGYNQARLLARAAGRRWKIPVRELCTRQRPTPPQHRLDAASRRRNLAGAFTCASLSPSLRHVAIIDDVMTTGSTLQALALALRSRGVEHIEAWVVARVE